MRVQRLKRLIVRLFFICQVPAPKSASIFPCSASWIQFHRDRYRCLVISSVRFRNEKKNHHFLGELNFHREERKPRKKENFVISWI